MKIPTQYLLRLFCFADVDAEKCVDKSLVQTSKLKFGYFSFRLLVQELVKILKLKFRRHFEAEVWSLFCC